MRFAAICVIGLLLPGVLAAQSPEETPNAKIIIGAVLPLSGSGASIGTYVQNGITLAHESLAPELRERVKIVIEDDGWQMPKTVSAFQKLATSEQVDGVLAVGSAAGNAIAPLAEKREVPFIAVGASDSKVSAGRTFSFTHWVIPEVEAEVMAEEIARRDYQRLALVGTEQEGAIAIVNAIEKSLKDRSLESRVVLRETFLDPTTDFRTFLAKARAAKVDGFVVCLLPGSLAAFAKQTRQAGIEADLIGAELFEDENEVKASNGALLGQWYVNADVASKQFEKAYRKKFGSYPGFGAANAYDATLLLIQALASSDTGEKAAQALSALEDFSGAAGVYSATGDNRFTLPATIKVVTENGFEKLQLTQR